MNEQHIAYKVRQHLNRGLHELKPETVSRLASARESALARQKQAEHQSVLATVGGGAHHWLGELRISQAALALVLFASVVLSTFWMADRRVEELGSIDSALLSDDLPIGAFTDKGFDAWLKRSASQ